MDRRSFGKMLFATGAVAAVPLPVSAVTQGAGRTGYIWAVAAAKARGSVSPEILEGALNVSPRAARALYARLMERGVITQVAGVGRVAAPVLQAGRSVVAKSVGGAVARQASTRPDLRDVARVLRSNGSETISDGAPQDAPDMVAQSDDIPARSIESNAREDASGEET